jgi:hypothetical protein
MKRKVSLFSLFLFIGAMPMYLSAQEPDTTQVVEEIDEASAVEQVQTQPAKPVKAKPQVGRKLYYGGNIGASFGNYTMVGIYPIIGYNLTPKFSVGVKFVYEYVSDKRYAETYTTSNYGGSLFARFRVIPQLYLHAEYAQMSYDLYNGLGESNRVSVPFVFVGAGYRQSLGGAVWMNAQVLFDVLQHSNSPYSSWEPFFSVGFGVGL